VFRSVAFFVAQAIEFPSMAFFVTVFNKKHINKEFFMTKSPVKRVKVLYAEYPSQFWVVLGASFIADMIDK
jgi:hypothetical protein